MLDQHVQALGGIADSQEEALLNRAREWVAEQGLAKGKMLCELVDDEGEFVDLLNLAWPNGLQEGQGAPVALLIDEEKEPLHAAQRHGFHHFTDLDLFKRYVQKELLSAEEPT